MAWLGLNERHRRCQRFWAVAAVSVAVNLRLVSQSTRKWDHTAGWLRFCCHLWWRRACRSDSASPRSCHRRIVEHRSRLRRFEWRRRLTRVLRTRQLGRGVPLLGTRSGRVYRHHELHTHDHPVFDAALRFCLAQHWRHALGVLPGLQDRVAERKSRRRTAARLHRRHSGPHPYPSYGGPINEPGHPAGLQPRLQLQRRHGYAFWRCRRGGSFL